MAKYYLIAAALTITLGIKWSAMETPPDAPWWARIVLAALAQAMILASLLLVRAWLRS